MHFMQFMHAESWQVSDYTTYIIQYIMQSGINVVYCGV